MLPFVLVTLFVSLFFTFAKFAMDKYNDGFSGSCNKELILALIFLINAGIVSEQVSSQLKQITIQ